MLCLNCNQMFLSIRHGKPGVHVGAETELFGFGRQETAWTGNHHSSDESFFFAVKKNCYICLTLSKAFCLACDAASGNFRSFYEFRTDDKTRFSLRFTIESDLVSGKLEALEPDGVFRIVSKNDLPSASMELSLTQNTFSDNCRHQIDAWLAHCDHSHPLCRENRRTQSGYFMRLLYVSRVSGNLVRLETFRDGRQPRYITMSHRWDKDMDTGVATLLKKKLQSFRAGINSSTLPQRFQDAITIARWINVEYLCIDAMCIIQDSPEDWECQSRVMGEIYAGSYCNIAAINANEGAGCFRTRPLTFIQPHLMPNPRVASPETTHVIGYDDFWTGSLLAAPLHKRAWVLQERLLSPRTIHFGAEQVFWECRCETACEVYPNGIPKEFTNYRNSVWRSGDEVLGRRQKKSTKSSLVSTKKLRQQISRSVIPLALSNHEAAHRFWSETVERYSGCGLTKDRDKLVAIAGICQRVKAVTGETYLQGLWDNCTLHMALLWHVHCRIQADGGPAIRITNSNSGQKPISSWSWASLNAKIIWQWPSRGDRILASVQHSSSWHSRVQSSRPSPVGIRVKASLFAVRLQTSSVDEHGLPKDDGSYLLTAGHAPLSSESVATEKDQSTIYPVIHLDTPMTPGVIENASLLPICTGWYPEPYDEPDPTNVVGLVVRASTWKRNAYTRLGVFKLENDEVSFIGAKAENKYVRMSTQAKMESILLI